MSLDITGETSALVEVMAWCRHHAIKDTDSDLTILIKISPSPAYEVIGWMSKHILKFNVEASIHTDPGGCLSKTCYY